MIISLLFLLILSIIYAVTASIYYLSWINGRTSSYKGFIVLIITITAFSIFYSLFTMIFSLISLHTIMGHLFTLLMVIASIRILLTRLGKTLVSDKPSMFMGIKYYVYDDELADAWTDGKKIFITTGLMRILNPKELYTVLLHEKGHIKSKTISFINSVLMVCWISIVILIPVIYSYGLFLELSGIGKLENPLSTILSLYLIGTIVTSVVLPISWICEHTADQYILVSGKQSYYSLLNILVKKELYNRLYRDKLVLIEPYMRFYVYPKILSNVGWRHVVYEVIKAIFISVPRDVITFIKRPIYITHPPTWLRIYYLYRILEEQKSMEK